jgi:hypothetical protein
VKRRARRYNLIREERDGARRGRVESVAAALQLCDLESPGATEAGGSCEYVATLPRLRKQFAETESHQNPGKRRQYVQGDIARISDGAGLGMC